MSTYTDLTETTEVHTVYHDGDGSVYPYDANGELMEWPKHWPEEIADVRTFCHAREIIYKR